MSKLLENQDRKIQPKLRMIANGSKTVNMIRAEQSAAVACEKPEDAMALRVLSGAQPVLAETKPPKPPSLNELAEDILVNVFIETQALGEGESLGLEGQAQKGNLIAATIPLNELPKIAGQSRVLNVELGDPLARPEPEISHEHIIAPEAGRWQFGDPAMHKDGEDVLIGIIDVQGFDFAHPDFLVNGETRFVRIWDQGGDARPSPYERDKGRYPLQFHIGAEFTQEHLNAALQATEELRVPPQEIEKQSQMAPSSHGTHVASIAAGNRGICRKAKIAGVLISLPDEDYERRKSFYDSTRIALAIDYLINLAAELGNLPLSINISLGTNGHAHDGSSAISRWIDSSLSVPGRSVCVAAGNAGQEVSAFPGDIGFVMGRIHTSGRVPGRYLYKDIEWSVVGNGVVDVSENELEIWYEAPDRLAVSVLPPGDDADWIGPIEPRNYLENYQLPDGSFLSIYNELYHPANGSNYIGVYLSPYFGQNGIKGIPAGTWKVRLLGLDVRSGQYHGWIERDDPQKLGRVGTREAWRFPSFFTEASNVDDSAVGSLACGHRVISVANLHEREERINISSSQGPTRDARFKPDVAAPGTDIVAANGFSTADDPWVSMTGTSMASPYVAGVIGLMLAIEPALTAAQIEGILHRTSRPLPGRLYAWGNDSGFGMIDPTACLREAGEINKRTEVKL